MGGIPEIEQVLQKLSELEKLVKLLMLKTSEISSSSKENMEMVHVVGLIPHDIMLEGFHTEALLCMKRPHHGWILDSGASKHVTGAPSEIVFYTPHPSTYKETIQTADGTCQPIKGFGTVQCTPSITLSSVLHVPSFPC
jgi:hypothetical protein